MPQDLLPTQAGSETIALGKAEYFVELHTPHRWSSGPAVYSLNPTTGKQFASLAEAAAYAEREHNPSGGEDTVHASYGVRYVTALDTRPPWRRAQATREAAELSG